MPQPIAYLSFNGNCEEAMRFYERVLDGRVDKIVRMSDMHCQAEMSPEHGKLVAHACLLLKDNGVLFGGDVPPFMTYEGIKGVSITLNYDTVEQAQRVFDGLAQGGSVQMPMQPAMWAKSWGMLVDRFGTPWLVNGELIPI